MAELGAGRLRMSTAILINPDASLDRFQRTDYGLLRRVCDHITLYGDHADGALFYSETFNRTLALGKHPFQLYHAEALDGSNAPIQTRDEPAPSAATAASQSTTASSMHSCTSPPLGEMDVRVRTSMRVRGAEPPAAAGTRNRPLEMDVIDVSWMDGNMHAMRHNFFNINRWMVDDLREILTTRNRARLRTSRMTHRFGNVYSFLAVPAHVVNP